MNADAECRKAVNDLQQLTKGDDLQQGMIGVLQSFVEEKLLD